MNDIQSKNLLLSRKGVEHIWQKVLNLTPEALWVFVGQAGTAIAGLIGIKLLTHVLNPSEFGKLALANTIVGLVSTIFFVPFGQGLMRFWSISKERGEMNIFYNFSNCFTKYICSAVFLITIVSAVFLNIIKELDWSILVALSLVTGIVTGRSSLKIGIFTAARQRKRTAILDVINNSLRPAIAVFLIVLFISNANVALIGYLLAGIFVLLIVERLYSKDISNNYFQLKSRTPVSISRGLGKEILSYSWPFFVWQIFIWVYLSCDRWALQTFHGSEVVGAFAVVSQLATYPLIFGSSFLSALFMPIVFQKAGDLSKNHLTVSANKILLVVTGIYILGSVFLIGFFAIFHHQLILLISNNRFVKFSYLLPGLTAAWALFYFGQVLSNFGMVVNQLKSYIWLKLVSSLIAAIGTFYLSAEIGISGVVWGLAAAGLVYTIWSIIISIKLVKNSLIDISLKKDKFISDSTMLQ